MKEKKLNRVNKKQLYLMVLSPIFEPWSPLTSSSKLLPFCCCLQEGLNQEREIYTVLNPLLLNT